MRRKIFAAMILSILSSMLFSYENGKYAGEFIDYSVDARTLALGNVVQTSFYNSAFVWQNPAYLPYFEKSSLTFSHSERFGGEIAQDFISFNKKISNLDMGLSFILLSSDGIKQTKLTDENDTLSINNRPLVDKEISNYEGAIYFSLGKRYFENLSYGVTSKLLFKTITDNESAKGIGFDVSLFYKFNEDFRAGFKAQDITSSVLYWTSGKLEIIRPVFILSSEYNFAWNYFKSDVKLLGGLKILTDNYLENGISISSSLPVNIEYSVGVEFFVNKMVFLRAGLQNDNWAAGTGLTLFDVSLDYTYVPDLIDLGESHKITLSYRF